MAIELQHGALFWCASHEEAHEIFAYCRATEPGWSPVTAKVETLYPATAVAYWERMHAVYRRHSRDEYQQAPRGKALQELERQLADHKAYADDKGRYIFFPADDPQAVRLALAVRLRFTGG